MNEKDWDTLVEHNCAGHCSCEECTRIRTQQRGTPLSELSGRPGHKGYEEFCRIATTWGY